MNAFPDATFWLRALGIPALQALGIIALAALVAPRLRSARAQRAAWLAGFGAIALVIAGSLAGMDRPFTAWLEHRPRTEPAFRVQTNLPVPAPPSVTFTDTTLSAARPSDSYAPPSRAAGTTGTALWWPAWLWLAGIGIVAGRKLMLQGVFARWWRRRQTPAVPSTRDEVRQVAHRLGMRAQVRVIEIPALLGPIAFGALRPTIGLPSGFATEHGTREREAMLAHELAHLAACDPVWLALADGICAVLWWVPPVWWAQRRLRAACEAAADEASLVVEDGPTVLADCLVTLAARLPQQGAFGILGMAVFRSELGRRVERLLALRAQGVRPSSGRRLLLAASLAAVSTATLGLVSSAWALPRSDAEQPTLLALAQEALAPSPRQPTPPVAAAAVPSAQTNEPTPALALPPAGQTGEVPAESGDWLVLDVQFPEPPETNRAGLTRASMDALTRRLYAAGEFSRVNCEPSAQGITVRLRFRENSRIPGEGSRMPAGMTTSTDDSPWPEFIGGLKTLVQQRGQLEFRRVHADSDRLAQTDQCPEGYEALSEPAVEGRPARRFIVERGAALGLTGQQIHAARAVQDPVSSGWRVSVEFNEEGAKRFGDLTHAAVGQRIAVVVDGDVLLAPMVRDAILGGRCEISGRFSEAEAGRMAALLQCPLPAALELVGWVQITDAVMPPDFSSAALPSATEAPRVAVAAPRADPSSAAVATLVQDARLLYELGKLGEAKAKLEQALRLQPKDPTAAHYRNLVREAELSARAPDGPSPERPSAGNSGSAPATPSLFTRTFRVDPSLLTQSLRSLDRGSSTNLPPGEALRRVFASFGVNFGDTKTAASSAAPADASALQGPSGRAMFYNDRTGVLLVRATLEELDAVESVLQALNEAPPQVMVEVKFVEITQEDSKALGFDWFLGGVPMGRATNVSLSSPGSAPEGGVFPAAATSPAAAIHSAATGQVATVTGILTDPQFRGVVSALNAAGTNAQNPQELRGDQLDWPGRSATNAENIRVSAALGAQITGILTDPQYRTVLKALEQRAGVDILAAPRVTTLSGRQAQIQVAELMTVMTAINPAALVQPGATPGTNTVPYLTSTIPLGPTLDIIPNVAADGYTISLNVIPTVTEFLGYDDPGADGKVRIWQDGSEKTAAQPLPRFRVRQMQTQAQVRDGQTLVLGGFPVEATRMTKDKVPVLGDLPAVGGLFRSEAKQVVKKNLVVFVTATIVDPAGNPVHSAASPNGARTSSSAGHAGTPGIGSDER